MFEARLGESVILKKVLEAIKDLLNEACFDCTGEGLQLQAMDNSHVSLVSLLLKAEGFEKYRCDRNITLGLNLSSLAKIIKCSNNDDSVTIKAEDHQDPDVVSILFESDDGNRVSDFQLKLMNLDQEHLGIPETQYACIVQMSAAEFARIVRDLSQFGDSMVISANKRGVRFSSTGDTGTANIKLAHSGSRDSEQTVKVELLDEDEVTLTFASRYLNLFAKAAGLSDKVCLKLSPEIPLVVEFNVQARGSDYGTIRYYLAPKIEDD